ncbi:MAG: DUF4965 domain-containing protein [Christensenellaceae bacterium]|nr:DUF4965 domain-containing protein [Christensenellaceae bacterium]
MIETRLPAYPLITLDPLISIWSTSDNLYDSVTSMWTGADKPINGNIIIDGVAYRFMGLKGSDEIIPQKSLKLSLSSTQYEFENSMVTLTLKFTKPLLPNNISLSSCPFAFIDVECKSCDGNEHSVQILISFNEKIAYDEGKKLTKSAAIPFAGGKVGYIGRALQRPLTTAGDYKEIDWGWLYLTGNSDIIATTAGKMRRFLKKLDIPENNLNKKVLVSKFEGIVNNQTKISYFNIIAFDDIASINYFGIYKNGFWATEYYDILNALTELLKAHDSITKKVADFDEKREFKITAQYGREYYITQIAAYRQVFAGLKTVYNGDELLCFSKECASNGCMNTVDVSFPASPLLLMFSPKLLKGLLIPVFKFARMKSWPFDFAPHDIGRYPFATGQRYGIRNQLHNIGSVYLAPIRRHVYRLSNRSRIYSLKAQMPTEECGNMIILSAAYFNESGDENFIRLNVDLLQKWVDYIISYGIFPQAQLCTDDFAGTLGKNVNLTIKSIIAIGAWGLLLNKLNKDSGTIYLEKARSLAAELEHLSDVGTHTSLTLNERESWSLKYNLIWDKIFKLSLFSDSLFEKECAFYIKKSAPYGIPLDSRDTYTKTDWMMWVASLTNDQTLLKTISSAIVKMLNEAKDRVPFTDWYDTITGVNKGFCHRPTQGGLWMPEYLNYSNSRKGFLEP